MSWDRAATAIAEAVARLRKRARLNPHADVVIIIRNDKTGDQLVGGTLEDAETQIAFLERAVTRLKTPTTYEDHKLIDRAGNPVKPLGEA